MCCTRLDLIGHVADDKLVDVRPETRNQYNSLIQHLLVITVCLWNNHSYHSKMYGDSTLLLLLELSNLSIHFRRR